jgi:peptide/nickel transport system permease protein
VAALVVRRLLALIPVLLGISLLTFLLIHLAPGDYLSTMAMDPSVSEATIQKLEKEFGLDRPVWEQYAIYLRNVLFRADFGYSFSRRQPVFEVLGESLGNTLLLSLGAALLTWLIAIPLGVLSAVKQHTWVDRTASGASIVGLAIPEVFLALLLMLFAWKTGWFPTNGMRSLDHDSLSAMGRVLDILHHMVLPALVLATVPLASRTRQMRANLLDVLRADYVTTARAKGLPENRVIIRHAVPNALNPLITLFGYTLGGLLSGSFLVENVMGWPGLGRVAIEALGTRDLYLVMGAVLMASTVLILGNLVADLLLGWSDPRIRQGGGDG